MALEFLNDAYFAAKVGIGVQSPSYELHVDGQVKIQSTNYEMLYLHQADANGGFIKFTNTDDTSGWYTGIAGTEKFIISRTADNSSPIITAQQNGNVGIGTASPDGSGWDQSSTVLHLYKNSTSGGLLALESSNTKAIINAGNNQLAIFTTTDDPMRFGTNGSESMRIDSSGNVGILTSSMLNTGTSRGSLTIGGAVAGTINIGNGSINFGIYATTTESSIYSLEVMKFSVGSGFPERMRITSAGNVGIGTTAPTTKLYVYNGEATIASATDGVKLSYSNGNSSGIIDTAFSDNNLEFRTNGTAKMWIANGGNVGIGTTNPQNLLHLGDNTNSKAGTIRIDSFVANQFWKLEPGTNTLNIKDYDGTSLVSFNGNSNFVLFNGGNVGIGTTSPSQPLEVHSTIKIGESGVTGGRLISADSMIFQIDSDNTGSSSSYRFRTNGTADDGTELMRIQESGNVGIGATGVFTTNHILNLSGTGIAIKNDTNGSSNNWSIIKNTASASGSNLTFLTATGTNVMDDSGRFGVGTTSPTAKLHVAGTGLFTGLVSGITPVAAANFVTKAYVDGSGGGTGPFLPLAGGTLTGDLIIQKTENVYLTLESTNTSTTKEVAVKYNNYSTGSNYWWSGLNQSANYSLAYGTSYSGANVKMEISTAGNATFAGDVTAGNATFAGDVTVNGSHLKLLNNTGAYKGQGTDYLYIGGSGLDGADAAIYLGNAGNDTGYGWRFFYEGTGSGNLNRLIIKSENLGNGVDALAFTQDGNATFAGDVTATANYSAGNSKIIYKAQRSGGAVAGDWSYDDATTDMSLGTSTAHSFSLKTGNTRALTINSSQNATFVGSVVTPTIITDSVVAKTTSGNITFKINGGATIAQFANDKSATFQDQVFAAVATSSGDASSTLTTKGYVDSLITGATIYRGTWNPDVSLNSGYGNPNLNTVTQTSGYYYICSADGAATPNGATTEPNSWNTGDWVIWNDDIGTSGEWQKIDNSSVLSGVGTGQTVALWEGAGSVTDSETLGNAPITVSGNNSTFAGSITFNGSLNSTGNLILSTASAGANIEMYTNGNMYYDAVSHNFRDSDASPGYVTFSASSASFENDVYIKSGNDFRLYRTDNATFARFNYAGGSVGLDIDDLNGDGINLQQAGVNKLRIETSGNATFAGNVGIGAIPRTIGTYRVLDISGSGSGGGYIGLSSGSTQQGELYSHGGGVDLVAIGAKIIRFYNNGSERMRIDSSGNVGIGTTNPVYKLDANGGIQAGGKVTYSKSAGSLNTTGYAVAGITALPAGNGFSCGFTFTCFGGVGKYQKLVYSCYNSGGTWNAKKVIDEGTNDLDVVASANGSTITFTFKAKSSTQSFTPKVTVEAVGTSINSTYA